MTATTTADTMRDLFARVTSTLLDEQPRLAVVMADIGGAGLVRAKRQQRQPRRNAVHELLADAVAGDGNVYLRLAAQSNAAPMPTQPGRFHLVRRGSQATVIAVGPMLDRTLEATSDLDVTVLYAATVRPFDAETLRAELSAPAVVLVEPYLQGTSAMWVSEALRDTPHRLLSIGVRLMENRHYGTPEEHDEAHCLDVASLRHRIGQFVNG